MSSWSLWGGVVGSGGFSLLESGVSLWKLGSRDGMVSGSLVSPVSIVWIASFTQIMKFAWVCMSCRIVAILVVRVVLSSANLMLSLLRVCMTVARSWSLIPRRAMVFWSSSMVVCISWVWVSLRLSWNWRLISSWVGFPCWKMGRFLIFSRILRIVGRFLGVWFLLFGLLLPILGVVWRGLLLR